MFKWHLLHHYRLPVHNERGLQSGLDCLGTSILHTSSVNGRIFVTMWVEEVKRKHNNIHNSRHRWNCGSLLSHALQLNLQFSAQNEKLEDELGPTFRLSKLSCWIFPSSDANNFSFDNGQGASRNPAGWGGGVLPLQPSKAMLESCRMNMLFRKLQMRLEESRNKDEMT